MSGKLRSMHVCRLFSILIALNFAGFAKAQDMFADVPLPFDIEISSSTSSDFTGVWTGKWSDWLNHILVVEDVSADGTARVAYSIGQIGSAPGRFFRISAEIRDGELIIAEPQLRARYSFSSTGRLRAVYENEQAFAVLNKRDLDGMTSDPSADWWSVGHSEYVKTELFEDGRAVRLNTVLALPDGDGPFPLAIVHHGSTGDGKDLSFAKQVWSTAWFADMLNEQGYLVAFPQRRGREGSDGLYDEGFNEDRAAGYSREAAVTLKGADRALTDANAALEALMRRPDVADQPVLLAGMSRGGVVAIMQAGSKPDMVSGVVKFVGGWLGEFWDKQDVNKTLFARIGEFKVPILSMYGEDDPFYSVAFSKTYLKVLEEMGANSRVNVVKPGGQGMGHLVMHIPSLWQSDVEALLQELSR
ncbi:MAG: dienelactone hydrolase family protein [Pseudomonadota bacterium]